MLLPSMTRPRHAVNVHKQVEELTAKQYELVEKVLGTSLASDWPRAWAQIADDRLVLAESHLEVASAVQSMGRKGRGGPEKRSVISRAYYAMFCAARAAVSLEGKGDVNDHRQLPETLSKMTSLEPRQDREFVAATLNKYRLLRNNADYSPYYPAPLGWDARAAVTAAKKVLNLCRRWVKTRKKARGIT